MESRTSASVHRALKLSDSDSGSWERAVITKMRRTAFQSLPFSLIRPSPCLSRSISRSYLISLHQSRTTARPRQIRYFTATKMAFLINTISSKLGYETLPAGIESKTFYDLKAVLPGKEKVLDFVSSLILNGVIVESERKMDARTRTGRCGS